MISMKVTRRYRSVPPEDVVEAWTSEADAVSLPRLDEVGGHPRPKDIGVTYAEKEYHALADEQEQLWPAEGEHDARPFHVRARGLGPAAAATEFLLAESRKEVHQAHADHQHAVRVLSPYVRREPGAKLRYWICWPLLVLGDMAGVWSAAVINGDVPYIAFWQALASGLAAGCAGLVGSELKDIRMATARRRDPESLTTDEQRYGQLFGGRQGGMGIITLVAGECAEAVRHDQQFLAVAGHAAAEPVAGCGLRDVGWNRSPARGHVQTRRSGPARQGTDAAYRRLRQLGLGDRTGGEPPGRCVTLRLM